MLSLANHILSLALMLRGTSDGKNVVVFLHIKPITQTIIMQVKLKMCTTFLAATELYIKKPNMATWQRVNAPQSL